MVAVYGHGRNTEVVQQNSPLRTLLVGAGDYGQVHSRTISRQSGARLVGVVEQNAERAEGIASSHDVPVWRSLEQALAAADAEVVVVATPTASHVSLAVAGLRAGAHVMVEKPVAVQVSDARVLARAAEDAGRTVEVVSQRRHQDGNVRLKQVIEDGGLGRIGSITVDTSVWRTADYFTLAPWRGVRALGGGNLANHGIHAVDLLTWFAGPVVAAHAFAAPSRFPGVEVEDALVAAFETGAGVIGTIHASLAANPGGRFEIVLTGDRGTARITDRAVQISHLVDGDRIDSEFPSGDADDALAAQYADFLGRIRSGAHSRTSLEAGIQTLEAVEMILESARPR